MNISNRKSKIYLTVIILLSITVSTFFMTVKQGFHEDELLTYNLANSSECLNIGGWNDSEDFNNYLSVSKENRFNYSQVYNNQIKDASHPPFYYALVHTVCSFFCGRFSKYFAFIINVIATIGTLVLLYKISVMLAKNNFYALVVTAAYAFSIACITTAIYLRMYALLTFFVMSLIYANLRIYVNGENNKIKDFILLGIITVFGTLTQYYFILIELLTVLIMIVFKINEKHGKDLLKYIIFVGCSSLIAVCIYPYIFSNVLGGNRGFSSLSISVDAITIVTYFIYKVTTYIQILAKDIFLNNIIVFAFCTVALITLYVYIRFVKKQKLSRSAVIALIPSLVFFALISLVSPFNSDRYIMASLPMITALYVLAFLKFLQLLNKKVVTVSAVVCLALACVSGIIFVKPYYVYGEKSELYTPQTDKCVFVGTAMLEWNKNIDKLANYDETLIVQTDCLSAELADELEDFAANRGVVTNGKITEFMNGYMNNGGEKESNNSLCAVANDEKLNGEECITVYVSRLADSNAVTKYLTENTRFKNYKIISEDYSFELFYNWYDYFAETESYCNVYIFY